MTIAPVGTTTTTNGTAITTIGFASVAAGQLITLSTLIISVARTVSAVSFTGTSTWQFGTRLATAAVGVTVEQWVGKVITPATANITVTWSASTAGMFTNFDAIAFDAGLGADTVWAIDKVGGVDNTAATAVVYPSLTPIAAGECYVGHAYGDSAALIGSGPTSGYTYFRDLSDNEIVYNPNCDGNAQAPVGPTTASQTSHAIAMLLSAGLPYPQLQPYTSRRRAANF